MSENPFIITEKIVPRYFCDRGKESAELIKLIENGNNIVMISRRRIGKTGLIRFCYEQPALKDNYICIYFDILSTNNLKEFIYLLGREIFEMVSRKGGNLWQLFVYIVKSISGKIGFDPVTGLPSLNLQLGDIVKPSYTLKEIFNYIDRSPIPCIVAIDEFQQISRYPEKNVEALIRSHLLQINNCRMIFSGNESHILGEMFTNRTRPLYQSATFMEIPVIPTEKYVKFIVEQFELKGKIISAELAERIYRLFDGVTFYVQRVCNGIYADTEPGATATEETLQTTLTGILASYDVIFRLRLSQLSTRQKELLISIAREGTVKQPTSVEFIRKYALSSASAVQTALGSLLKGELIVKSDDGYMLEDRFFRMWMNKNY